MNGFVGALTFIPEGEYFICFLTNDDNTPKYALTEDMIRILNGEEVQPVEPEKLIELTPKMKSEVIGDYLVRPGDTLHVFEQDERLYLRETGQMKQELFPIDSRKYAFTLLEFKAVFSEAVGGVSDTVEFVGGGWVRGGRIGR